MLLTTADLNNNNKDFHWWWWVVLVGVGGGLEYQECGQTNFYLVIVELGFAWSYPVVSYTKLWGGYEDYERVDTKYRVKTLFLIILEFPY